MRSFDYPNRAHAGAARKGYQAALDGKPASACPYRDLRRADGRLTGSRGFRVAWRHGYDCGQAERASANGGGGA